MAINYDIIIRSKKITQEIATEIFSYISKHNLVHFFKYLGYANEINCYIRGYADLREILIKHGFDETDFTEIMDESNRAYRHMTALDENGNPLPDDHPERIKDQEIANEIETEVAAGNFTIWAVGKAFDEFEKQLEEASKNYLNNPIKTTTSSFNF